MSFSNSPNNPGNTSLVTFNAADYGFDTNGNDVNALPWARLIGAMTQTLSVIGIGGGRGFRLVFPAGNICLNNCTLDTTVVMSHSGSCIIEGQAGATRIFPGGGQGRALTVVANDGILQSKPTLRDMHFGYGFEFANPDLDYRQPILELRDCKYAKLDRITGFIGGTGTLLYLNETYNASADHLFLYGGQYGVPILIDRANNTADQMDTISLKGTILGEYGVVENSSLNTFEIDQLKMVKTSGSTLAESTIVNSVAAGDVTATLSVGGGASFAIGDSVGIDVSSTGSVGAANFEVNKITGIAGDVLTFAWPFRWAHNGAGYHVQIVRGGVAVSLGNVLTSRVHDSHMEGHDTGILTNVGGGLALDGNSVQCNRYVRMTGLGGSFTDLNIGPTIMFGAPPGAPTSNIVVDVPTWAPNVPTRLGIDGPLQVSTAPPTVSYKGTSYTLDSKGYVLNIALGGSFAAGPWNPFGVKLGREGLRFRGLLTMAAPVVAATAVFTLPGWMVPRRSSLPLVYQTNSQSTTATPASNVLFIRGSDQGSPGQVSMQVASAAAGWLDLDSVPLITTH